MCLTAQNICLTQNSRLQPWNLISCVLRTVNSQQYNAVVFKMDSQGRTVWSEYQKMSKSWVYCFPSPPSNRMMPWKKLLAVSTPISKNRERPGAGYIATIFLKKHYSNSSYWTFRLPFSLKSLFSVTWLRTSISIIYCHSRDVSSTNQTQIQDMVQKHHIHAYSVKTGYTITFLFLWQLNKSIPIHRWQKRFSGSIFSSLFS